MRGKIFLSLALVFVMAMASSCGGNSRAGKVGLKMYKHARNEVLSGVLETFFASDDTWIRDKRTGVCIWNPEPIDGESMHWSGNAIREGDELYAHGFGEVVWYFKGRAVQVDRGLFQYGKPHGTFTHRSLYDGNIIYSEWNHGEKL